jgi:hypothetical protein
MIADSRVPAPAIVASAAMPVHAARQPIDLTPFFR